MPATAQCDPKVHRFEVSPRPGFPDPTGEAVARDAKALGLSVGGVRATHVYLIEAPLSDDDVLTVRDRLLTDPVTELARLGASPALPGSPVIEVHPLPGVMDPVAQSVEEAVRHLTGVAARVSTGWRYDFESTDAAAARRAADRLLANPVIQRIETSPWHPAAFPAAQRHGGTVRTVAITGLDDGALERLSRDAHLFLSLAEMRAIQAEYRRQGREPREIELETLAQTWSEHCVHKTLKSTIRYTGLGEGEDPIDWRNRPNHTVHADGSVTVRNLLKSTVAAATFELIAGGVDWTLSVFTDNSGVVALDEQHGVCIKVETHNHPSAIEPYGGAATGAGGCIRDVMGTGLGARPIANTDVFCVAHPTHFADAGAGRGEAAEPGGMDGRAELPPGTLHPARVLRQVVAGVRDYGNRMGIPTVAGAVHFDDRYVGNPLVFCGCVGLIPRHLTKGKARPGDRIVALGGRTGRDGIHGATFSSTELEHTSADEFAHAVQVGNAIEEKRVLDALLRARDHGEETGAGPLYHAVTDCGAGGFSSAVGEMGGELGAEVHLDRAPLKYPGLSPTEVWISEAQERMVLAVPPSSMPALRAICEEEGVELADLGHFGTKDAELVLLHHGVEFGRLSMHFLHEGLPMPERTATFTLSSARQLRAHRAAPSSQEALLALLAHPTIASKHWIVRQYDHEVRGGTVVKPLVGPAGRGPGDAAVIEPIPGSGRGVALSCGLQTPMGDPERHGDPYLMALAAIDEAVRNVVCVGGDPARTAILDNFCWPSCGKPENLGSLVRAAEGCYDAAKAYRTPFVSGKDSLNNQLTIPVKAGAPARTIQIPPTLLITALALVRDVSRCVTMDAKAAGNLIVLVGDRGSAALGGSHLDLLFPGVGSDGRIPRTDLVHGPANARAVAAAIAAGLVRSAHDCSEGGVAVAVAEMLIAATGPEAGGRGSGVKGSGVLGAEVNLGVLGTPDVLAGLFSEAPSRYLVEVEPGQMGVLEVHLAAAGVPHAVLGRFDHSGALRVPLAGVEVLVTELVRTWSSPLDW